MKERIKIFGFHLVLLLKDYQAGMKIIQLLAGMRALQGDDFPHSPVNDIALISLMVSDYSAMSLRAHFSEAISS